jgi:hyperosmotically inducible protein
MKTRPSRLLLGTALSVIATTVLIGCNKAPEVPPVASPPSSTMGTQLDDSVITSSVKSALLADATPSRVLIFRLKPAKAPCS